MEFKDLTLVAAVQYRLQPHERLGAAIRRFYEWTGNSTAQAIGRFCGMLDFSLPEIFLHQSMIGRPLIWWSQRLRQA